MSGLLAIDAAGSRAGVAVLGADGTILVRRIADTRTGLTEILPALVQASLVEANTEIGAVAVTIGPGSFTGLRNAISIAQGYAAASGIALLGIPVAEAFAAAFPAMHRPLWVAIRARKGRLFILRDGLAEAYAEVGQFSQALTFAAAQRSRWPAMPRPTLPPVSPPPGMTCCSPMQG